VLALVVVVVVVVVVCLIVAAVGVANFARGDECPPR
jgi:hypothetical protein